MVTRISHSPAETEALGEEWGRVAQRGWVIALSGDLGAGKTHLVRGLARGLGSPARVHSPTFTLLNQYEGGRLPLFHLDLYRLNSPEEIIGAGLEMYLENPAGVAVVEWVERWLGGMANDEVRMTNGNASPRVLRARLVVLDENTRRITYEDFGN